MINPRRLTGTAGNIARYYAIGDYYTKGNDELSEWGGRIAAELGLGGKVDPHIFRDLLEGKVAGQQLGRHRADGEIEHHPGWDFAVSAPKSVSIMALVAGDSRIAAVHEEAVSAALTWLEDHAAFRYRDNGKIVHETTGRLIYARFTEHASRELDPHLHTHVVVMNITNRDREAPMTSLESRAMFAEQMTAGQIYRNALAWRLRELGYAIDADHRRGLIEIGGVPRQLISDMSQRAHQIDAHAEEHGLFGQAEKVQSVYQTRKAKEKVGLEVLQNRWVSRLGAHRDAIEQVRATAKEEARTLEVDPALTRRAASFGIRHSEEKEAVNNLGFILRRGLAAHVGEVRMTDLQPLLQSHEKRGKLLPTHEQTGDEILTRGRTSRRTARLEMTLARHLALAIGDAPRLASSDRLLTVLETANLVPKQEMALATLAGSRDRIIGIHGVAGSGKSTLVKALVAAADDDARLIALAPTSSAAANLGDMAGIESRTVASLLARGPRRLGAHHILIIDEAGQLGNRQALRLMEMSHATGARILLLGDNHQTGAIEQGKAFWLLQRLGLPRVELSESLRQKSAMMKRAVEEARLGHYAASLHSLDKVVTGQDGEALAEGLVAEWVKLKPAHRDATNILVLDNATRQIVNGQIRDVLRQEGTLAQEAATLQILTPAGMSREEKRKPRFYASGQIVKIARGDDDRLGITQDTEYRVLKIERPEKRRSFVWLEAKDGKAFAWYPRLSRSSHINVFNVEQRELAVGDRIQWRLATPLLGLKNAERGTIVGLEGATAQVKWDRGDRMQTVDLDRHKTWDYGYAETVYASQSKTYARAYILAPLSSPLVNGQNYYTAITRAKFGAKIWTEDLQRLAEKLTRHSGEKTSALEALNRLKRDGLQAQFKAHGERIENRRMETARERTDAAIARQMGGLGVPPPLLLGRIAKAAQSAAEMVAQLLDRAQAVRDREEAIGRKALARDEWGNRPQDGRGPER